MSRRRRRRSGPPPSWIGSALGSYGFFIYGTAAALVLTLFLMEASTFLVGCPPTYDPSGVLAPVLLVVLRLCQGFSASEEQAGANSITLAHAPDDQRAYFTSFRLISAARRLDRFLAGGPLARY